MLFRINNTNKINNIIRYDSMSQLDFFNAKIVLTRVNDFHNNDN